jgi:hypothetical protein
MMQRYGGSKSLNSTANPVVAGIPANIHNNIVNAAQLLAKPVAQDPLTLIRVEGVDFLTRSRRFAYPSEVLPRHEASISNR